MFFFSFYGQWRTTLERVSCSLGSGRIMFKSGSTGCESHYFVILNKTFTSIKNQEMPEHRFILKLQIVKEKWKLNVSIWQWELIFYNNCFRFQWSLPSQNYVRKKKIDLVFKDVEVPATRHNVFYKNGSVSHQNVVKIISSELFFPLFFFKIVLSSTINNPE